VIETNLEVRFPRDDEAAVLLESNTAGAIEKQAEIILFCLYAARAISNLRQTEAARALTRSLAGFERASTQSLLEFASGDVVEGHSRNDREVRLVPSDQSSPGDKTFDVSVRFLGDETNPRILFAMKPKGFGLLGKSVDFYAPGSVLIVLLSLLKRRSSDTSYIQRLARSAGAIGRLALTDIYAFGNQMDVAVAAADFGWRAVALEEVDASESYPLLECPSCGNSGSLAPGDEQLEYRLWPSETERIRRCRRCGAGLWVQDGEVRMISSPTWTGIETMHARLEDGQPSLVSVPEEDDLAEIEDDSEAAPEESTVESSLLAELKKVFTSYRWPYSEVEGMPVLLSELAGPLGSWTFYAQIIEDQELIVFYSVCPLSVPEGRRPETADFLTRANYGLAVGNFELDFDDGEIRYKTVLEVEGRRISKALVKKLVRANGLAMETYLPAIGAVVGGTPSLPALDRLTSD